MKHIKLFESFDNIEEDIRSIFQELVDDGIINKVVFLEVNNFHEVSNKINFFIRTSNPTVPIYWKDIKDYVIRVKDYLGYKFDACIIRKHPKYREDIDKNEDTEPEYVNINIDEETNIEYGLWSVTIRYTYKNDNIKTYNQFNEELTYNQRVLLKSPLILSSLLVNLIDQYPLLNFKWNELKKKTTDGKFPAILVSGSNLRTLTSKFKKIKKSDLPKNKLSLSLLLRKWNIYLFEIEPNNRIRSANADDVIYISRDELKPLDRVIVKSLPSSEIYKNYSNKKPSEFPTICIAAKIDNADKLKDISDYIDDILIELKDEYPVDIKTNVSTYGDSVKIPISFNSPYNWDEELDTVIHENAKRIKDYIGSEGYKMDYYLDWYVEKPFYYYGDKGRFKDIIPIADKWSREHDYTDDAMLYHRYNKCLNISYFGGLNDDLLRIESDDIRTLLSDPENCRKHSLDVYSYSDRKDLLETSIIREVYINRVSIIFKKKSS